MESCLQTCKSNSLLAAVNTMEKKEKQIRSTDGKEEGEGNCYLVRRSCISPEI